MNLITGCLPLCDLLNRKSKIHYCCSQMMTLIAELKSMNSILEKKKTSTTASGIIGRAGQTITSSMDQLAAYAKWKESAKNDRQACIGSRNELLKPFHCDRSRRQRLVLLEEGYG